MLTPPSHVLITGASSGIGAALARRYAAAGARLSITGRDPHRLMTVARACLAAGSPEVETASIDVRDADALTTWIAGRDAAQPVDLLIANAGVTGGAARDGRPETGEASAELMQVNVLGALAAVHAVLPAMMARGSGQIAMMSSLAAFIPLGGAPTYCASKAANYAYALALRRTVKRHGVAVSAVCPGYVDTPLLRQLSGKQPVRVAPDDAAVFITAGLAANRRVIAFPGLYAFLTRVLALMPEWVVERTIPSTTIAPWSLDDGD